MLHIEPVTRLSHDRNVTSCMSFAFVFIVGFRLGEVLDPNTKLYMVLYGDKGESGKIYLLPDGSKFEPDKFYKVSVNIKDIGNVSFNVVVSCFI